MRLRLAGAALGVAAAVASVLAVQPAGAADTPGFHVSAGRLLDANNRDFVARGINHAHAWYPTTTPKALKDIKATGANTVRVVLATGDRWTRNSAAEVADIVSQCKTDRLVCILEAHDTTGYGEQSGAVSLDRAADYWIGVKSALQGQEKYVILNLGNEPFGNVGYAAWTADTKSAVQRLRAAGFQHTLLADAPNWGQDWAFTMRDNAAAVFDADPQHNTVFSIHMYGVFDTAAEVTSYLDHFVQAKLPIMVGEFGNMHSDGDPDENAIMAESQRLGIGYLGWSWSGNGGGVEYLDLTTGFDPAQLTPWGQRLVNGADGIRATSHEASIFGDGVPPTPTPSPTTPGTPTGTCSVGYRISDWGTGFNGDVTIRNTGTAAVNGWALDFSFPADQKVNSAWNARASQSGRAVHVVQEDWTRTIPAGGSVSFGFNASSVPGTNGIPAAFVLNGAACSIG
ncbi:hypothetical protein KCMC57_up05330 [Kitasatospora sp. CMC57]|uniref:Endoglucanase n=1 Tax=Kitasatospora sp. CMC57 TaxID=3231513 RepID=A0AB33JRQ8_9ACTN